MPWRSVDFPAPTWRFSRLCCAEARWSKAAFSYEKSLRHPRNHKLFFWPIVSTPIDVFSFLKGAWCCFQQRIIAKTNWQISTVWPRSRKSCSVFCAGNLVSSRSKGFWATKTSNQQGFVWEKPSLRTYLVSFPSKNISNKLFVFIFLVGKPTNKKQKDRLTTEVREGFQEGQYGILSLRSLRQRYPLKGPWERLKRTTSTSP